MLVTAQSKHMSVTPREGVAYMCQSEAEAWSQWVSHSYNVLTERQYLSIFIPFSNQTSGLKVSTQTEPFFI